MRGNGNPDVLVTAVNIALRDGRGVDSLQILKAGAAYFALVFGAGFVLGTIRTAWVVPRFGTRVAELAEAPFMLVAIFYAARYAVRTVSLPSVTVVRLGAGLLALSFLLAAELTLVRWLRGIPIQQYFKTRDPVAATAYYILLIVYALMPIFVARK